MPLAYEPLFLEQDTEETMVRPSHERRCGFLLALSQITRSEGGGGGTSCHVVRMLKQPVERLP